MATKVFVLLFLTHQTLAGVTSSSSSSSSSASSRVTSGSSINELTKANIALKQRFDQQLSALEAAKKSFAQGASWYFPESEVNGVIENVINEATQYIDYGQRYIEGEQKLLSTLPTGGFQPDWIDRFYQLEGLSNKAIENLQLTVAALEQSGRDVYAEREIFENERAKQLIETKAQMERNLQVLFSKTKEIGLKASTIMTQAVQQWATILRRQVGPTEAVKHISEIEELTAQALADLAEMRPEDIEETMNDSHRCMNEVKEYFIKLGIPANVIRQSVNLVQQSLFATLMQARSTHF